MSEEVPSALPHLPTAAALDSGAGLTAATLGGGDVDYTAVAVNSVALHSVGNAAKLGWWAQWARDRFGLTVA